MFKIISIQSAVSLEVACGGASDRRGEAAMCGRRKVAKRTARTLLGEATQEAEVRKRERGGRLPPVC